MTSNAFANGLAGAELGPVQLLELFRRMLLIRRFEETAFAQSSLGKVHGALHLSVGQEAVAVGVCASLRDDDFVASTHRGHAHCLAKGVPANAMLAELFGRVTGSCKGRGGSMHIADIERGVIGCNGVVAANLAIAAGVGQALKNRGQGGVAVCFFGESASNRGPFLEALNLAAVWELPVLYVCENNHYGQYTSFELTTKAPNVFRRAEALGLPASQCDGMRVEDVHATALSAIDRIREGAGPALLEADTYRFFGHALGDTNYYRTKEEIEQQRKRDPIAGARRSLEAAGASEADIRDAEEAVERELEEAVAFAGAGPVPSAAELGDFVYSETVLGRIRALGWEVFNGYPG